MRGLREIFKKNMMIVIDCEVCKFVFEEKIFCLYIEICYVIIIGILRIVIDVSNSRLVLVKCLFLI